MTHIPYEAVLFDLDGTLINSTEPIVYSTLAALDELGWEPVPRETIVAHIGYKLEVIFSDRSVGERAHLIDTIGRHYDEVCAEQTVLYPGMAELLAALSRQGVPMGVVTSKRRGHSERILSALQVRHHFTVLLGCDDVTRMKPDPEGLLTAVAALNVVPGACLYVGDTGVDVAAAQGANMAVAGVAWGTDGREKLLAHGVDHSIDRAVQLSTLF